jgi:hypothetical protein
LHGDVVAADTQGKGLIGKQEPRISAIGGGLRGRQRGGGRRPVAGLHGGNQRRQRGPLGLAQPRLQARRLHDLRGGGRGHRRDAQRKRHAKGDPRCLHNR